MNCATFSYEPKIFGYLLQKYRICESNSPAGASHNKCTICLAREYYWSIFFQHADTYNPFFRSVGFSLFCPPVFYYWFSSPANSLYSMSSVLWSEILLTTYLTVSRSCTITWKISWFSSYLSDLFSTSSLPSFRNKRLNILTN